MDVPLLDREMIGGFVAPAHAEGLLVVAHVSTTRALPRGVDFGADGLVHVWGNAVVGEVGSARIAETGVVAVPTRSVLTAMAGLRVTL